LKAGISSWWHSSSSVGTRTWPPAIRLKPRSSIAIRGREKRATGNNTIDLEISCALWSLWFFRVCWVCLCIFLYNCGIGIWSSANVTETKSWSPSPAESPDGRAE
jgi:hypothetical protein